MVLEMIYTKLRDGIWNGMKLAWATLVTHDKVVYTFLVIRIILLLSKVM